MSTQMTPYADSPSLQDWVSANTPRKTLYWEPAFGEQIGFVRDRLAVLFLSYEQLKLTPVRVVGSHTSKSVVLPVYGIVVPEKFEARLRCNFYNWVISVASDVPIADNFCSLFQRDERQEVVYSEGFSADWVFGSYTASNQRFSLTLTDNYRLYTFCYLLREGLGLRPTG